MDIINQLRCKGLFAILLLLTAVRAPAQLTNPDYNQSLSDSLHADEYGMKMYVLVILKDGPVKESDKKKTDSLFAGHLTNIRRLADEGLLTVAGPIGTNDRGYRGIFILNVKTTAEAQTLLQTDPVIKGKLLDADLYPWYGSAALPMYLPYSKKVEKKHF